MQLEEVRSDTANLVSLLTEEEKEKVVIFIAGMQALKFTLKKANTTLIFQTDKP